MQSGEAALLRKIDDAIETAAIAVSVAWERRILDGWHEAAAEALGEEARTPIVAAPALQDRAYLPFSGGAAGLLIVNGGFPASGALFCVVMSMIAIGFLFRAFAAAASPAASGEMRSIARRARSAIVLGGRFLAAVWIAFPLAGLAIACLDVVTALKGIR